MTQALAKIRKPGIARAMKGNLNSAKHSWRTFLKRRVLVRPEDRVALRMADRLAAAILSDKGGPDGITAGETALLQAIVTANICSSLCLLELGRDGAFKVNADGDRVASPALKEVGRFLSEMRQGLVALGLGRRTREAVTLTEYLARKHSGPIPVEAEVVEEGVA